MLSLIKKLTNWYNLKRMAFRRSRIEAKYIRLYLNLDLDFDGYRALQQLKNEELNRAGLTNNPYSLVYWKQGWSKTRTEKNNTKYWQWEIEQNGLKLP